MEFKLQRNSYNTLSESILNEDQSDYIKKGTQLLLDAGVPQNKVKGILTKLLKLDRGESIPQEEPRTIFDMHDVDSEIEIRSISYSHHDEDIQKVQKATPFLLQGTSKPVYQWLFTLMHDHDETQVVGQFVNTDGRVARLKDETGNMDFTEKAYTRYIYPRAVIYVGNNKKLALEGRGIKYVEFLGVQWIVLKNGYLLQRYAIPGTESTSYHIEEKIRAVLKKAGIVEGAKVPYTEIKE